VIIAKYSSFGEHTTCTARPLSPKPSIKQLRPRGVIGIVLNDFPAANYGFHFVGTDHAQRARHLPGSREVKTKGAFEPHPAHFRESPSNFLQRFDLIVAYQPLRKNGSHGRAAGYLMFSRRYRVLTF